MSASNIRTPDDSGNGGKYIRTNRRSVGGVLVEEHFFIPISERQRSGVYLVNSGTLAVQAAAHTTLQGFLWILNPSAVNLLAIRRMEFTSQATGTAAMLTSPRITVERVIFSGSPTGPAIVPVQIDTNQPAAQSTVRTSSAGLTLSTVGSNAAAYAFFPLVVLTGVGASVPAMQEWEPNEEGQLILRPGQGAVVRQADAGTASDSRRFEIDMALEEFTVP